MCLLQIMMTSSNGSIFRVTGPLCGEFTGPGDFPAQRPVTRSFDVFFDRRVNKRLSKQLRGWWLETPSWSLWRHRNVYRTNYREINVYGVTTIISGIRASSAKIHAIPYWLSDMCVYWLAYRRLEIWKTVVHMCQVHPHAKHNARCFVTKYFSRETDILMVNFKVFLNRRVYSLTSRSR